MGLVLGTTFRNMAKFFCASLLFFSTTSCSVSSNNSILNSCESKEWTSLGAYQVTNSISRCDQFNFIELNGNNFRCDSTIERIPNSIQLFLHHELNYNSNVFSECSDPRIKFLVEPECVSSTTNPNNKSLNQRYSLREISWNITKYYLFNPKDQKFYPLSYHGDKSDFVKRNNYLTCSWMDLTSNDVIDRIIWLDS